MSGARAWPQVLAAFAATLGAFGLGTTIAWTSPALPRLHQNMCGENCDLSGISTSQAGWIGGMMPLGAMLSGPITGWLLESMGRKWTMITYSIPFAFGFLLLAASKFFGGIFFIYFGRLITGFAGGAFALAAPLYIVEIAEPRLRGALASLMQLMVTLGIAFVDVLSIGTDWVIISALCTLPPLSLGIIMSKMPESPGFLARKGMLEQANCAIKWLRGNQTGISTELPPTTNAKQLNAKHILTQSYYCKPLGVSLALMFFQQFSGINVVIFYAEAIFADAGNSMGPGWSSFILALSMVFGTSLAVAVVEKFGRKLLLFVSGLLMSISISALGTFFYAKDILGSSPWQQVPLISLICYIISFSIGFGPLPWTINAEIFPAKSKSFSSTVAFCFNWTCGFVVTCVEPQLILRLSPATVYFSFAAICLLGAGFAITVLPETKGRNPDEGSADSAPVFPQKHHQGQSNPAFENHSETHL